MEYLSDVQIISGDSPFDPIFNRIILTRKVEFFKGKVKGQRILLSTIIHKLKHQFQVEKCIATKNGMLKSFRGFWSPIYMEMQR